MTDETLKQVFLHEKASLRKIIKSQYIICFTTQNLEK